MQHGEMQKEWILLQALWGLKKNKKKTWWVLQIFLRRYFETTAMQFADITKVAILGYIKLFEMI